MINLCINVKYIIESTNQHTIKYTIKYSVNKELYFINYYLSIFGIYSNLVGIDLRNNCKDSRVKYYFEFLGEYPIANYNNNALNHLCKYLGIIKHDYRIVGNNVIINIRQLGNKSKSINAYYKMILINRFCEFTGKNDKILIRRKIVSSIYADLQHKNLTVLYNNLSESLNRIL